MIACLALMNLTSPPPTLRRTSRRIGRFVFRPARIFDSPHCPRRALRQEVLAKPAPGPVLVHCSAGVRCVGFTAVVEFWKLFWLAVLEPCDFITFEIQHLTLGWPLWNFYRT